MSREPYIGMPVFLDDMDCIEGMPGTGRDGSGRNNTGPVSPGAGGNTGNTGGNTGGTGGGNTGNTGGNMGGTGGGNTGNTGGNTGGSDMKKIINEMVNRSSDFENWPIAMAYVPWQQWRTTYDTMTAWDIGTIFPELDLPFEGRTIMSRGGSTR